MNRGRSKKQRNNLQRTITQLLKIIICRIYNLYLKPKILGYETIYYVTVLLQYMFFFQNLVTQNRLKIDQKIKNHYKTCRFFAYILKTYDIE